VGSRGKQAELLIRAEQEEGRVSPLLHSQFAEHLGSCVYGGLWVDEGSPISNIGGYPKSAIEFLQ